MPLFPEFKCSGTRNLCMNQGNCTQSNFTGESCICPPSFTHDYIWFHTPNCALGEETTRYFFIAFAIQSFFAILFSLEIARRLKSDARRVAVPWAIFLINLLLFALFIYIQNGCYEGCAVFGNLSISLIGIVTGRLVLLIMKSFFSFRLRSFPFFYRLSKIWSVVFFTYPFAFIVPMVLLTRNQSMTEAYNLTAFLSAYLFWVSSFFQAWIIISLCKRFREELKTVVSDHETFALLDKRLLILQVASILTILPFILKNITKKIIESKNKNPTVSLARIRCSRLA